MATIFVLSDPSLYDADTLTARLEEMSAGRYGVESVPGTNALLTKLEAVRQAVVFFSAPSVKLVTFVQHCRSALPGTAFVAVVSESDIANLPVFETDCHFLLRPYDGFQVMSQLAAAVRQSELMAAIADSSQVDEVTNLFSRRYFLQRLSEEISLSKRHLSPLCCVIVGVNLYQVYLDSYGYDFINALLRYLSDQINGMTRHEDITARVGDNEIAILLPRSTEKGAKVFTNRLVQTLNSATFKYGGYVETVTVFAGVAGYPLADGTPATPIHWCVMPVMPCIRPVAASRKASRPCACSAKSSPSSDCHPRGTNNSIATGAFLTGKPAFLKMIARR